MYLIYSKVVIVPSIRPYPHISGFNRVHQSCIFGSEAIRTGPLCVGKFPANSSGRSFVAAAAAVLLMYSFSGFIVPSLNRCCRFSRSWAHIAAPILFEMLKMMPMKGSLSNKAAANPNIRNSISRSTMNSSSSTDVIIFLRKYGRWRVLAIVL